MELTKREIKMLNSRRAKVEKLTEELDEYFAAAGDEQLPDIECTFIGYSVFGGIEITDIENGFRLDIDGNTYDIVFVEEDGENWLTGWDEAEEDLKYQRRRLNKAWRVFRAENPDFELEIDED